MRKAGPISRCWQSHGWRPLYRPLLAAYLGEGVGLNLPPEPLAILLAVAALWAAYDLVRTKPPKPIAEPTRSAGAIFYVMLTGMAADSARLVLFVIAALMHSPIVIAAGGALGAGVALTYGWLAGERMAPELTMRRMRIVAAVGLIVIIAFLGFTDLWSR